jgi:hypothetical protein
VKIIKEAVSPNAGQSFLAVYPAAQELIFLALPELEPVYVEAAHTATA